LSLPTEILPIIDLPVHGYYDITVAPTPIIALGETIAEKLARYRRVSLARDLYDLHWFAQRPLDERLVRRLWVMKVYFDVVDDDRGDRPFDPSEVLELRHARDFVEEDIGYLTQLVDIGGWIATVRRRYEFLRDLDGDEQRWVQCNPRDRHEVATALDDWVKPE
jgi:predicted nucleotidyltransferase component of viral defense system